MMGSDKDRDRSRRSGAEDRGWSHRSGTRFSLIWSQNRLLRFPGLGLKTDSSGLVIWASKPP
jgi:hypothetical protein